MLLNFGFRFLNNKRIKREKATVEAMVNLYCRKIHGAEIGLCDDCSEVLEYSIKRTDNCVFGADKPPCEKCQVHCYKEDMRKKIKTIMRYSGPRMIWRHPWFTLMHIVDKLNYRKQKKSLTT